MILQVMREVNNFFAVNRVDGLFKSIDKKINLYEFNFLAGQYVAVTGSVFNNNVYQVDDQFNIHIDRDEEFDGSIYGLAPPIDFLKLVDEIETTEQFRTERTEGVVSERFENYSWTASVDKHGNLARWQTIYIDRLNKYRKMFPGVKI